MPKKCAEEFMQEAKNTPVFSQIALIPEALP